jgi:hypothetical protein
MGVTHWVWLLTIEPYDDVDTITLEIADTAFESWEPGIESWTRYQLGAAALVGNVYFQPTLSLPVLVRPYGSQDPDTTILSLFQSRDFVNADATLQLRRLGEAPPDTLDMFKGVIRNVAPFSRDIMRIDLVGEDATAIRPMLRVSDATYPDRRQYDENAIVPILAGATGWDASVLLRDMGNTVAGLSTSTAWRYFVPTRGMSTGRVVDIKGATSGLGGYDIRVNSVPGITQPSGTAGPLNGLLWPDDTRVPLEIVEASPAIGFDLVNIPGELAANYPLSANPTAGPPLGGPQDGQIRVRRYHSPQEVDDPTAAAWANFSNALDRTDYSTYAQATAGNWGAWFQSAGRFMRYPARPYLAIRAGDGGDNRQVALVWGWSNTNTNLLWELRIKVMGQIPMVTRTVDLRAQAPGWAIISVSIPDNELGGIAGADDFISFMGATIANRRWWGENTDPGDTNIDHIAVRAPNAATTAAFAPRIATLGLSFESLVEPGPLSSLTKGGYLRGVEMRGDQMRPAEVIHSQSTQSVAAGDAIIELMINATLDAKTPLLSGDFNAGSGVGSWVDLKTAMNNSIAGATGSVVTSWLIALVETRDLKLEEILSKAMNNMFCDIWYSPRQGKYQAQIFQANQASHGATLYYDDLAGDRIEVVGGMSADNVWTAIYVECWDGSRSVSIDNSTRGSRQFDGTAQVSREAEADAVQAIYGRRVKTISLEYVRDPAAAWDVCTRMWALLRDVRPICRFAVDPAWGIEREQSEVFETDASLDAVMPIPVRGASSWDGEAWQIRLIEIEPRGGCWITAQWNGPFPSRGAAL